MASRLFTLGFLLVLVAIGYQFRKELGTVVSRVSKFTESKSSQDEGEAATPTAVDPGPDESGFPEPVYYNPPFDTENPSEPLFSKSGTRLITLNELAAHGHAGPLKPLWLAVLGRVYDVEKGAEHYYGPNGGYKFFTG